jgi:hypothetical protein
LLEGSDYIGSGHTTTASFDPKRQKLIAIGEGITVWDVDPSSDTVLVSHPATSGDNAMETAGPVGFDYDPVSETFLAWAGGQAIYALDVDSWTWTLDHVEPPDARAGRRAERDAPAAIGETTKAPVATVRAAAFGDQILGDRRGPGRLDAAGSFAGSARADRAREHALDGESTGTVHAIASLPGWRSCVLC